MLPDPNGYRSATSRRLAAFHADRAREERGARVVECAFAALGVLLLALLAAILFLP